uniref:Uncharacterized protein n=1 Tax=Octopus bimaculoides TaxID=37653 RepID=A0A0L8GS59_OCTBM
MNQIVDIVWRSFLKVDSYLWKKSLLFSQRRRVSFFLFTDFFPKIYGILEGLSLGLFVYFPVHLFVDVFIFFFISGGSKS